jgi:protein subunit release factor A
MKQKLIMEIRAGEGGMDSKLFCRDMAKMYLSYAKKCNLDMECL